MSRAYRKATPMTWYDIPNHPKYECNEKGKVRHKLNKSVLATKVNSSGRLRVGLYNPASKKGEYKLLNRVVLSAKLGRELEAWEECRHLDGNKLNNSFTNLAVGDRIHNVIDDYELGTRHTTIESIESAIERLLCLKSTLSTSLPTQNK